MPIYRYRCTKCDSDFEKIMTLKEKLDEKRQTFCPYCGSEEVGSVVSKSSFSLKGKGWYKDGYS